ncbi:hypothetical protein RIF29_40290 [Crotalaria pallida]|uniref:BRCT domain-containing protein n=1 Tax=Crotalaria pallida TaxID=3830 RepID=A0AAN9HQI3_CROPI
MQLFLSNTKIDRLNVSNAQIAYLGYHIQELELFMFSLYLVGFTTTFFASYTARSLAEVPRLSEAVVVIVAELGRESNRNLELTLSGSSIYVDPGISSELRSKVVETASRDGATLVEQWLVDCNVSHVVTKGTSIQRYLGYSSNLITPLWILKTAKEKCVQRLVHMSADLARQVSLMLEENNGISGR